MKKILVSMILLVGLSGLAKAEDLPVSEVIKSSATDNDVVISSYVPTQMDATAVLMNNRVVVAIQNKDASYDMHCRFNSAVTLTNGFIIPKNYAIVSLPIGSGSQGTWGAQWRITVYCLSENPASTGKAVIIQGF